jgi:hypothetical protein
MPQFLRECDIGIGSVLGRRLDAVIVVAQLDLDHAGLIAYRVPAANYPCKTGHYCGSLESGHTDVTRFA